MRMSTSSRGRALSAAVLAAALVAAIAVALGVAPSALAATGTVSWTNSCLNVRTGPGSGYSAITCLSDGTVVNIDCQTTGDSVTGPYGSTNVWDHLPDYGGYVTDAYVETGSNGYVAPQCGSSGGVLRGDDYPYSGGCIDCPDQWQFLTRECTSFVAWRMNQLGVNFTNGMNGGWFGNAETWDDNAWNLGWRVDNTPSVNAIAQWNAYEGDAAGGGHVAYVAAVNGDGTVTIEEYNWMGYHNYHSRTIAASAVGRYIHVPGT
jgi:surface antigen